MRSSGAGGGGGGEGGGAAAGASLSGPVLPQRKRPYIYVYDLPPAYNSRMLQYRVEK